MSPALQFSVVPVAVGALFAVVGVAAVAFGGRDLLTAYRLWRTDPTRVADVPNRSGTLEVRGRAREVEGAVASPFTGTACLACEWVVEEERHTQHGTNWVEIDSGSGGVPFLVEDDSGSVLVDPSRADLRLTPEPRIHVEGGERPPDRIAAFIESSDDVDSEDRTWSLGGFEVKVGDDRRYVEKRLDPGEDAYVYGEPTYEPGVSEVAGQVNYRFERALVSDTTGHDAARRVAWDGAKPALFGLLMLGFAALFGVFFGVL